MARALLPLVLAAGCTAVIPAQRSSDLEPRPVTTSLPIGVNPLLFNLEPGHVVGGEAPQPDGEYEEVYRWGDNFRLRRHAFQNPAREELKANGFVFAIGDKAAYQLKSTIEYMVFNRFADRAVAEVRVLWAFEGPNGLEVRTNGYAETTDSGAEALYRAYRVSLRNLLARDEILARFAPKGLPVKPPTTAELDPSNPRASDAPPDPPRPAAVDRTIRRPPEADSELPESALDIRARPGVVTLLARDRWSSGVVVGADGLVITSAYLVAGVAYVNLVLHDGTTKSAKVLMVDNETGLALVRSVSSGQFAPLPVRLGAPGVGDSVTAYGTPYHPALSVSIARGMVLDSSDPMVTDVKVVAGNAGGPIVDRRGTVVGIVKWNEQRTAGAAPAICVPMKTVFQALRLSYE